MNRLTLNCGYVPLVDSAPLIIAQTLGFAEKEGIALNLLRQPSWAALRDLLALGHLHAAHMLSPMPIAMTMGLSGIKVETDALMMMSINGTVTGASNAMIDKMLAAGWDGDFQSPHSTKEIILRLSDPKLRVGVPFPYSMHSLLFRYWMGEGIEDFELVTNPPPLMAGSVEHGELDLFTVGEPWGTIAVETGVAQLILPGAAIWQFAPEKAIATRRAWANDNPNTAGALLRAIYRACAWLDQPKNKALASEILARSEHLDLPEHLIYRALTGQIVPQLNGTQVDVPNFLQFHRSGATFPWRSQAGWIGAQIAKMHDFDPVEAALTAEDCYRTDIYRQELADLGIDQPGASAKLEGAMVHRTAVASTNGNMILGPDAFFDGNTYEIPEKFD